MIFVMGHRVGMVSATGILWITLSACGANEPAIDAAPIDALVLDASAPACSALVGPGTNHAGTISAAETWTAEGSPHLVPTDITIVAAVTLADCAVVRLGAGRTITVIAGGSIHAAGLPGRRVTIEAMAPGQPWASIRAIGGTLELEHTVVRDGGDRGNGLPELVAALDIRGDAARPTQEILDAQHLEVLDSASQGLYVHDGGGFALTSLDLRVSGSAGFPVHIWGRALSSLPAGDYTGNGTDEILVTGSGGLNAVREDVTMHARGVPYRIGSASSPGGLVVATGTAQLATLTIEPGVTLRFSPASTLRVEPSAGLDAASGALVAVGTAAAPIVFTSASATPAAGDWQGIWFGKLVAATTRVDHVRVEYAGGASVTGSDSCHPPGQVGENDAAIRLLGSAAPTSAFVTNTEIVDSARHGIDRGFRSDTKIDFLPSNSFVGVAGCKQTLPRDANGGCPANPACP